MADPIVTPDVPPADPAPAQPQDIGSIVAKAVDAAVSGLKEKNSELLTTMSGMKTKLETFENLGDADNLKNLVAQIESAEEQRMIQEGNIEGVVDNRTKSIRSKFEGDLASMTTENEELKSQLSSLNSKFNTTVLNNELRNAAVKAGVETFAIEDAMRRGESIFALEDGALVARDSNKEVIVGLAGKGSMTAFEFFDQKLKADAPHFYPGSQGAGFQGSTQKASLEDKMAAAAEAGKWDTYNKLRAQRAKSMAA